jgi:hypothetical protein
MYENKSNYKAALHTPRFLNRRLTLAGFGLMGIYAGITSFGKVGAATSAPIPLPVTGLRLKVVVVGGGMAGATAAKYFRLWGGAGIDVTLVESRANYVSNIFSSGVLNETVAYDSLNYGYESLNLRYGVKVIFGSCIDINAEQSKVTLDDGQVITYDRLVLAPGVEFMDAWGLSSVDYVERFPHAWEAGPQTVALERQLHAMRDGDQFALIIPKAPYRCPPGPYERACVVADYLRSTQRADARVTILDENLSIQAKVDTFTRAFMELLAPMVRYEAGCQQIRIDPTTKVIQFINQLGEPKSIVAQVISPIAPHRARGAGPAGVLDRLNLNASSDHRWCPVNVLSYESNVIKRIHIIGDASQNGMPKAGHVANQEAKICVDAILRSIQGLDPDRSPVANSACYSTITSSTASWLTAVFQYDPSKAAMVAAGPSGALSGGRAIESDKVNATNYQDMQVWYKTLMADSFF